VGLVMVQAVVVVLRHIVVLQQTAADLIKIHVFVFARAVRVHGGWLQSIKLVVVRMMQEKTACDGGRRWWLQQQ